MGKTLDGSRDYRNVQVTLSLLALALLVYGLWGGQQHVKRSDLYSGIHEPVQIGKSGGQELSDAELERLLTTPPPLRGFQNKTGVLDLVKWLPELRWWRTRQLNQWFEGVKNGSIDIQTSPSNVGFGCEVFVNHDYRYFWIRQCKTGSTTIRSGLGQLCKTYREGVKSPEFCTTYPWRKAMPTAGDPYTWWMDYFVFSSVRNPYSRFPSAYQFLQTDNHLNQTMGESCRNPFLVQKKSKWSHGNDHYMRHIMQQTSCLFTAEGGMAVDFIAQTENMEEDFKIIAQEINKNRRSGVPPLKETLDSIQNSNPRKSANATYAPLYRQYPECIEMVEKIYRSEFEDLQYIDKR